MNHKLFKWILALFLLIISIIFMFLDNEAIFPSTLVALLLVLTLIFDNKDESITGKSARLAVIAFSIVVIILNITVTIFLPIMAQNWDLSGQVPEMTTSLGTNDPKLITQHFVEVTLNDMHELCFTTTLLLTFNIIFYLHLIREKRNQQPPERSVTGNKLK